MEKILVTIKTCPGRARIVTRLRRGVYARILRASQNLRDSTRQKGKREKNKRFTRREKQRRARANIKKETEREGAEFSCEFFLRPLSAFTLRSAAKTKPEGSRDRDETGKRFALARSLVR